MKISGLKQRKIALPRPKVSLRLKRPTLSRGKIVLLCVCAALLIACCVLGFVYSDTAGRLLAQQAAEVGGFAADQIKAVGLGLPGLVDNKTGYVIQTPNMPFDNTPIREMFQAEWDVPVYLGNDANCAAIGEYWAGAAKGCDPAVVVTLGTGIGSGMVAGGRLFTGYANSGMEAGHMIIQPGGAPCGCGNHGCWEQYGSATALIRMTRQAME